MRFSLLRTFGYFAGGLWTAWGGQKRIEATQLHNLRRFVEKARRDSPLFRRLYADLGPSSDVDLRELPVTRKPDLMREFDDWLTIRSLPLETLLRPQQRCNAAMLVRTTGTLTCLLEN